MQDEPKRTTQLSGHNYAKKAVTDEEDLVDKLLKQTGCAEQNFAVQECMFEHRDWRKCQDSVSAMKKCMEAYETRKKLLETSNAV
jgi:cytochrome c oxidase assembly factor 4